MILTCPQCAARFSLEAELFSAERAQGALRRL
ncbi:MAG: hypothetical protein LRY54_04105 [Alphaproteobacteria bacterium]|nr:hypothetical protein [Alphaproteobacteria bacterium]